MTDGNGNTTNYQYDARKRLGNEDGYLVSPDHDYQRLRRPRQSGLRHRSGGRGGPIQPTTPPTSSNGHSAHHPDPAHNTNNYSYDALGNLTGLADENGHTTILVFDTLNEPVRKLLPDDTHRDAHLRRERQSRLAHPLQRRHHHVHLRRAQPAALAHDPRRGDGQLRVHGTGKRPTMTDGAERPRTATTHLDRLTAKATPEGTLSYSYDAAGNLQTMSSNQPTAFRSPTPMTNLTASAR